MYKIQSNKKNYGINFPTSLEEITTDSLLTITEDIKLPKNYCLIALAFKTKLFDFVAMINGRKDTNVGVIPIMAKISDEDSKKINANIGDRLIIPRSNLERAVHANVKSVITSTVAQRYFQEDNELVKTIMSNKLTKTAPEYIYILEFKIIPINDINGAIINIDNQSDPFIVINKDNLN